MRLRSIKFISFAIVIIGITSDFAAAQGFESLRKLDNKQFQAEVERSPSLVTQLAWEFFYNIAKRDFDREEFTTSRNSSEKAKTIAEKLNDDFVSYQTYSQLGKIAVFQKDYDLARSCFDKSIKHLAEAYKENPKETPTFTPDFASLYYYWAYTYSDPDRIYAGFDNAFKSLNYVLRISDREPNSEFDDIYTRTSLQIARCFGYTGNHLTKLLWIENAKLRFSDSVKKPNELRFQIHNESIDALNRLGNYSLGKIELEKISDLSKTLSADFKLRYLLQAASFNGQINNVSQKHQYLDIGIDLATKAGFETQLSDFYVGKLFQLLLDKDLKGAKSYLALLEDIRKNDPNVVNEIDIYVAEAVIAHHEGNIKESEFYFKEAESYWRKTGSEWQNGQFLLGWWSEITLFQKDFEKLKTVGNKYLDLVNQVNEKDSLPFIYIILARAYLGLGNLKDARSINQKALYLIEQKRTSKSADVSTGVFENLFEAYQLEVLFDLAENNTDHAFITSEKLKARWLTDKITGAPIDQTINIDPLLRTEIFDLSLKILKEPTNKELFEQLSKLEKQATSIGDRPDPAENNEIPGRSLLTKLANSPIDDQTAVVSYAFTIENKLTAFVWNGKKGLTVRHLDITKDEVDISAESVHSKIKNRIFFKQDGQRLYNKLIEPLGLENENLIIVPDKSLWKIPFQALTRDGKTYLIEDRKISYAPSVSILLNQLSTPSPVRSSFQVFSNSTYKENLLKFADKEAMSLAELYGVKPMKDATESSFRELSAKSDILHFSMHAEVDQHAPFNSFLSFKPLEKQDGKLTVDEILKVKLKQGSLVFLASCDTTNVLNGEGLVSLSWAMMASGATTVISAQWEANDESTEAFTNKFYENYRKGSSSAEALQKASLELIHDKTRNMHEPYYWAEFTLNGDYR